MRVARVLMGVGAQSDHTCWMVRAPTTRIVTGTSARRSAADIRANSIVAALAAMNTISPETPEYEGIWSGA